MMNNYLIHYIEQIEIHFLSTTMAPTNSVIFQLIKKDFIFISTSDRVESVTECVSTVMLCIVIVYILPGKFILY